MSETETRATPPLAEFLVAFAEDDNEWWRLRGGDHLNPFEELLDERDAARAEVAALRSRLARVEALADEWDRRATDPSVSRSCIADLRATLAASVGSSGEAESGEACIRGDGSRCVSDPDACAEAGVCWPGKRETESGAWANAYADPDQAHDSISPAVTSSWQPMRDPYPAVPSGGQADGEGADDYPTAGDVIEAEKAENERLRAALAARPVLSREAIRRETFAEVSRAMNRHADMWERDGSDPCRVRVERELANAYRAYAEGYGEPTGSRRDVLTAGGEQE